MMETKYSVTFMSPDGDRRWVGDIPASLIPRSGEIVTVVDSHPMGMGLPPLMKGMVSNVGWSYHNGVATVTVQLMPLPEKHVSKPPPEEFERRCAEIRKVVEEHGIKAEPIPHTYDLPYELERLVDRASLNADDTRLLRQGISELRHLARELKKLADGLPVPKIAEVASAGDLVHQLDIMIGRATLNVLDTGILRRAINVLKLVSADDLELKLARVNPIQRGVDKAREMASSNPVLELEVLLMTTPNLDGPSKALLRRVIRALKDE